jgi:hypothetical protein
MFGYLVALITFRQMLKNLTLKLIFSQIVIP